MKTEIRDTSLLDAVRTLLGPVLLLYDRLEVYDIVVVDDAVPFTMLDSGVVLVISTGLIRQCRPFWSARIDETPSRIALMLVSNGEVFDKRNK